MGGGPKRDLNRVRRSCIWGEIGEGGVIEWVRLGTICSCKQKETKLVE